MGDPDRAREPSMEEILASIRRIISDDKKDAQSESKRGSATPHAGEPHGRSEPPEPRRIGPDVEREQPRAAARAALGGDVFAAAGAKGGERSATAAEERHAEEPRPAPGESEQPGGAFAEERAEPGSDYEPMAEPDPEQVSFREQSEQDFGAAAFALRGSSDFEAAPHRAAGFEAEARTATGESYGVQEPVAAEEPAIEDAPAAAAEVAATDEPTATEGPAVTGEPAAAEDLTAAEELAAVEPAPDEPAGDELAADEPTADEPAATDGPAAMQEAAPIEEQSRLISARTDASVASAFAALEDFVLSTHSQSLEDLVSETLHPLLREWLDANLPPLVERLVREEIERVSRGRR